MKRILAGLLISAFFMSTPAYAISSCRARTLPSGDINVIAKGIAGTVHVGTQHNGPYPNTFANDTQCISGTVALDCRLGVDGSDESTIPPSNCTLYLKDNGAECAARIKYCTPGMRIGTASGPAVDYLLQHITLVYEHTAVGTPDAPWIHFLGNLATVNGTGFTDTENTLGNIRAGYNDNTDMIEDLQLGSHNIIAGRDISFTKYGGLAIGLGIKLQGDYAAAIGVDHTVGDFGFAGGGIHATVAGDEINGGGPIYSVCIGGVDCTSTGYASVGIAGWSLHTTGDVGLSLGGVDGTNAAPYGVRVGGQNLSLLSSAVGGVIKGGLNRTGSTIFYNN